MESTKKEAVGLKRKRMSARMFKTFFEKPQKNVIGGDAELERENKLLNVCDGDDNSEDDMIKKQKKGVNENCNPACIQGKLGAQQPTQLADAVSDSDAVRVPSKKIRRENVIEERSPCILSGLQSSSSVSESEGIAVSSDQQGLHDLLEGGPIESCQTLKPSDEIQEFLRTWEHERLKMEVDHKLEVACIRLMHGQGSIGISKQALLKNVFTDSLEKHNILKKQRLKELEAEHLAASLKQIPDSFPADPPSVIFSEMVNHATSLESDLESDKEHSSALPEDLAKEKIEPDKIVYGGSQNAGQPFLHSQSTVPILDSCKSFSNQVQQQNSSEVQKQDSSAVKIQLISEIELLRSGRLGNVDSGLITHNVPLADGVTAPVLSTDKCPVSVHVPCSANVSDSQLPDQEINLPQAVKPMRKEMLLNESSSLNHGNVEKQKGLKGQPAHDLAPIRFAELSHNTVTAAETQNQAAGIDLNHVHEQFNYFVHQPILPNPSQSSSEHLFQIELENLRAETSSLEINHKNVISTLKSDCTRELIEIFNQIRSKYGLKMQETEAEFVLKQDELNKKWYKISMNKKLAELLRSLGRGDSISWTPAAPGQTGYCGEIRTPAPRRPVSVNPLVNSTFQFQPRPPQNTTNFIPDYVGRHLFPSNSPLIHPQRVIYQSNPVTVMPSVNAAGIPLQHSTSRDYQNPPFSMNTKANTKEEDFVYLSDDA